VNTGNVTTWFRRPIRRPAPPFATSVWNARTTGSSCGFASHVAGWFPGALGAVVEEAHRGWNPYHFFHVRAACSFSE